MADARSVSFPPGLLLLSPSPGTVDEKASNRLRQAPAAIGPWAAIEGGGLCLLLLLLLLLRSIMLLFFLLLVLLIEAERGGAVVGMVAELLLLV